MNAFADIDQKKKGNYIKLLTAAASLSNLFSDSNIPYINYRITENVFCRCFKAENLSRTDTAYDAKYENIGIGLKTFVLQSDTKTEKVAEFNSMSSALASYKGYDLAKMLAKCRNDRIDLANNLYEIDEAYYHIIGRRENEIVLFETPYCKINTDAINSVQETNAGLKFCDEQNSYLFNRSKSTLFQKFVVPSSAKIVKATIIADPYEMLLSMQNFIIEKNIFPKKINTNFVILPLYSARGYEKYVPERSGLNQWNAMGRKRNPDEVYISIPQIVHQCKPGFFPPRDTYFNLVVPTGEILTAKVCQENSKALMTNPNKALADWLLRKLLNLPEGHLATMDRLNTLGIDSVIIYKIDKLTYKIDKAPYNYYNVFKRAFKLILSAKEK